MTPESAAMETKKYQIFVSSTYDDLIEERKEITQAILKCGCIPAGMELWPPSTTSRWQVIQSVIDDSDYYVLILAGKYGSEKAGEQGEKMSYTEMEYDYAVKTGKPILALLHKNPEKLPACKTEKEAGPRDKLKKFKEKVMAGPMVSFWTSANDIQTEAVLAIENAIQTCPARGWTRGAFARSGTDEVHYFKIDSMEEAREVAEKVMQGEAAILNLEAAEPALAQRIFDFITGCCYAENASCNRMSQDTFLLLPGGMADAEN